MDKAFLTSPAVCFCLMFLAACAPSSPEGESQFALGTVCHVNLFEDGTPALYSRVFSRLHELEDIFSANRDGTDLDRVNQNAGIEPVRVREELITVLETALAYAEKSGGFFDPSIGPLVKLWGIGSGAARVPGAEKIAEAVNLIDYKEIEINRREKTVFLRRSGMALDLGAIAKGYAADETARLLAEEGVERAIIDLGGNIFALGTRAMGERETKAAGEETFWRVGVQDPRAGRGNYLGVINVKNKSVVTSGIYERYFEENGARYHHIFNVESGFPVENNLLSVTIVADKSIDADALSTAAFSLGWEKGRELIAATRGAAGIFVFDDLTVRLTDGLESDFSLAAAEYRLLTRH